MRESISSINYIVAFWSGRGRQHFRLQMARSTRSQGPLEIADLLLEVVEKQGLPMETLEKRLEEIEARKKQCKNKLLDQTWKCVFCNRLKSYRGFVTGSHLFPALPICRQWRGGEIGEAVAVAKKWVNNWIHLNIITCFARYWLQNVAYRYRIVTTCVFRVRNH